MNFVKCTLLLLIVVSMTSITVSQSVCNRNITGNGVVFNPYPGDCRKFVQCWGQGEKVSSCPFGQFWDANATSCRPSNLVRCTADPCKQSSTGFTYGMKEYGCRAYWKCIDSFSVGHCCPKGKAYVEGTGCLENMECNKECPPSAKKTVSSRCDKKPHLDKRNYIENVYGQGEIVRPCPAGTIFFEGKCACDFDQSGILPETRDERKCRNPADIVFVVDGSDSVKDQDFVRLKNFLANLIDNFEIGPDAINVGVVVYSINVGDKIGMVPYKAKSMLKAVIRNLRQPKYGTNTAAGIQAAREMIHGQGRRDARKMIIVITDGRSADLAKTISQANIAKAQGETVIAIGIGRDIFSEELNKIASSPKFATEFTDFRALANAVTAMTHLVCTSIDKSIETATNVIP